MSVISDIINELHTIKTGITNALNQKGVQSQGKFSNFANEIVSIDNMMGVRRNVTLNNTTPDLQTVHMSFGDIAGQTSTSSFTYIREARPLNVSVTPKSGYSPGTVTKTESGNSIIVNVSAATKLPESNNESISKYPFTSQYINIDNLLADSEVWSISNIPYFNGRPYPVGMAAAGGGSPRVPDYSGHLAGSIEFAFEAITKTYFIKTQVTQPTIIRITFSTSSDINASKWSLAKAKADMTETTASVIASPVNDFESNTQYVEYTIDQNYPYLVMTVAPGFDNGYGIFDIAILEISIRPAS